MKQKCSSILAAVMVLALIFGCVACAGSSKSAITSPRNLPSDGEMIAEPESYLSKDADAVSAPPMSPPMEPGYADSVNRDAEGRGSMDMSSGSTLAQKMIYTAQAQIETTSFDDTISDIYTLLQNIGGFVEDSYITGVNYSAAYYNHQTYRTAEFALRVPSRFFSSLSTELSGLGYVTSLRSNATNITTQFIDTESRLNTYKAEESRLLDMLSKAMTVEDMISIESRISNVRYEIESLTSKLRNWQNEVDYSTVELWIYEVAVLSSESQTAVTYWSGVSAGFSGTLNGLGEFFKALFKFIVAALPVLVVLAVILITALLLLKKARKKRASAIVRQPGPDEEDLKK